MPARVHIRTGDIEQIAIFLVDTDGAPLTGKSDLTLRISRFSDGYYVDWDDMTFKEEGDVIQPGQSLTEYDPILSPGQYYLVGGFSTTLFTNANSDDTYTITAYQSGTGAANLPQVGQIKVGGFLDDINESREPVIF